MRSERPVALAVGLDVFVVTLFVAIGRRNHDGTTALAGVLETAAPFLIGLAAAWAVFRAWRRPFSVLMGVAIWPVTVLAGMLVRSVVFDGGTATSFVIVATVFLGTFLVGWRAALRLVAKRVARQSSGGPLIAK